MGLGGFKGFNGEGGGLKNSFLVNIVLSELETLR